MYDEFEWIWKEAVVDYFKAQIDICQGEMRKIT
jgi:hypothetical protein